MRLAVLMVAVALVLSACSGSDGSANEASADSDEVAESIGAGGDDETVTETGLQDASAFDVVPPVEVFGVENELSLNADAYCWRDECASGDWTEAPVQSVGAIDGEMIFFSYPVAGWRFRAFVQDEAGQNRISTPVDSLGGGEFSIGPVEDPSGPVVELFGQGPAGEFEGDATVVFLVDWNTADG